MKFEDLEPRRCENIKPRIVGSQVGPKLFWTFEKQAPDPSPELGACVLLNLTLRVLTQLKPQTVTKFCL